MSIFGTKTTCAICEKEIGLKRQKIADNHSICLYCFKEAGFNVGMANKPFKQMTVEDVLIAIEAKTTNNDELSLFSPTKKIGKIIEFDDNQKKWLILSAVLGKRDKSIVYNYSDIVDFELLEDGESISQGGLGRALVGGALFGGAGAVVGGVTGKRKNKEVCNSLKIKITLNDINTPAVYVSFLPAPTKKSSFVYKTYYQQAHECLSVLQLICDQRETPVTNDVGLATGSAAEEIKKFKNLLDEDIITQEEFDAKKKELLGL